MSFRLAFKHCVSQLKNYGFEIPFILFFDLTRPNTQDGKAIKRVSDYKSLAYQLSNFMS